MKVKVGYMIVALSTLIFVLVTVNPLHAEERTVAMSKKRILLKNVDESANFSQVYGELAVNLGLDKNLANIKEVVYRANKLGLRQLDENLGIETIGGVYTLIERRTVAPVSKVQIFSTAEDNQNQIKIHILAGNSQLITESRSLLRIELINIPPAQRGVPQIEVNFLIDKEGLVKVSAKDLITRKDVPLRLDK